MTRPTASAPVLRVLERLEKVRPSGGGWVALCPAHLDKTPSLSVAEGEAGCAVVHCHAGCAAEAVVQAAGLRMADLFCRPPRPRPLRTLTFPYVDEPGELLYEVVRKEWPDGRRTFSQRRPNGRGGWLKKLGNVRRVLYRLPDVLQADPAALVFVVEGEKKADQLAELGLVATSSPGGAGKWREEYAEALRGRVVVILPDNDEPGRRHAEKVLLTLRRRAREARVVELPGLSSGGDVLDWLEAGGDADALVRLVEATAAIFTVETGDTGETVETGKREYVEEERCSPTTDAPPTDVLDAGVTAAYTASRDAWAKYLAREGPRYRTQLWDFVHALRWHPALEELKPLDAMARVEQVLTLQHPAAVADPWEVLFNLPRREALIEFDTCWTGAKFRPGHDPLPEAFRLATEHPESFPTDTAVPDVQTVLNVAKQLQAMNPGGDIALCLRGLGRLLNVSHTTAGKLVQKCVTEGYLVQTAKAVYRKDERGRCARYRFDAERRGRRIS